MQNQNKLEIKFYLKNLFLRDSRRKSGVGKMNGTAISQSEITPVKLLKKNFKKYLKKNYIHFSRLPLKIVGLRPSNRLCLSHIMFMEDFSRRRQYDVNTQCHIVPHRIQK